MTYVYAASVEVTRTIEVSMDRSKFDDDFWREFNESMVDRGGPDFEYLAQHIAWNVAQGSGSFVEGVGDLREMGVTVTWRDGGTEISNSPTQEQTND